MFEDKNQILCELCIVIKYLNTVMAVTIIFPIFHQTLSPKRSERPFDAEGLLIFFSFPFSFIILFR